MNVVSCLQLSQTVFLLTNFKYNYMFSYYQVNAVVFTFYWIYGVLDVLYKLHTMNPNMGQCDGGGLLSTASLTDRRGTCNSDQQGLEKSKDNCKQETENSLWSPCTFF